MTEICGWRAFPTARTAKHFSKYVRIVTQVKKKVWQLPAQKYKILIPTPPSFSVRAHFWFFTLQQHSVNLQQLVLKICSNYFKFAATLFYLQQVFNLQHVPCGPPYQTEQKMKHWILEKDLINKKFFLHQWEEARLLKNWKECILFYLLFFERHCRCSSGLYKLWLSETTCSQLKYKESLTWYDTTVAKIKRLLSQAALERIFQNKY